MKKRVTESEIISQYDLWRTYVDPNGLVSPEEFDAMSRGEKCRIIHACFSEEYYIDDDDVIHPCFPEDHSYDDDDNEEDAR